MSALEQAPLPIGGLAAGVFSAARRSIAAEGLVPPALGLEEQLDDLAHGAAAAGGLGDVVAACAHLGGGVGRAGREAHLGAWAAGRSRRRRRSRRAAAGTPASASSATQARPLLAVALAHGESPQLRGALLHDRATGAR